MRLSNAASYNIGRRASRESGWSAEGQHPAMASPTFSFLSSFNLPGFIDSLVSLAGAFVLGTLIGAERQYRQRGGGLRTHVLVSLGAATFVDIGSHLNGNAGAAQIISYVVSGVGFLGAGVIMKQGNNVWGLNTAATLWCSAAVGACARAPTWRSRRWR
jgi:putative Mg2+ transporter-C (MgtC) family protein